ncbi:MAG: hypothetical protein ACKOEM_13760 [Planctomycetia bacterium]
MHAATAIHCTHAAAPQRQTFRKFNCGFPTFHGEEIEAGRRLHSALMLIHGAQKAQRLLRADAASVFRPLRYGRRWISGSPAALCVMVDRSPWFEGKAGNEHILIPGRRGWKQLADRVHELTALPRWAEGFTGAAEALDDMGYAVAESIAAMLCWGIDSDESIMCPMARP